MIADPFADPATIEHVLRNLRVWAVVGCSANPNRPSHSVTGTLLRHGFEVMPVNPREHEVFGRPAYPDLAAAAEAANATGRPIEVVDIFRRADLAGTHVDEAAAARAHEAGLMVVMDRCPAIELPRLGASGSA